MGLLLRAATLTGGSSCAGVRLSGPVTADVRVDGDLVAWIDPPGTLCPAPGDAEYDLSGYLLLPAPAEPHIHLDLALLADRVPHQAGDLADTLEAVQALAGEISRQDVLRRARRAARTYLGHGTTAVRSHVHVGGAVGLRHLEALLELKEELRGLMTLQLVAFAIPPLTGVAGAGNVAALRQALASGADLAGGAPYLDPDPEKAVLACLDAAAEAGTGADLHVDDPQGPSIDRLSALSRLVRRTGFDHRITVGHTVSLGRLTRARAARIVEELAAAGIGVVTLPQAELFRSTGAGGHRASRGVAGLRALFEAGHGAGLAMAAGGGNLRDPFNPMGRGDPLETASLLVTAAHLSPAQAYGAVSAGSRAVMGLPTVPTDGVLTNDVPAELLAVRAALLNEAIAAADADRTVISGGRVAVRTRVIRNFPVRLGGA